MILFGFEEGGKGVAGIEAAVLFLHPTQTVLRLIHV